MFKKYLFIVLILTFLILTSMVCIIGCGKSSFAGKYVNQDNPSDYLELRPDGIYYSYTGYSGGYNGEWEVKGNELRLSWMGSVLVIGEIKGNKIIFPTAGFIKAAIYVKESNNFNSQLLTPTEISEFTEDATRKIVESQQEQTILFTYPVRDYPVGKEIIDGLYWDCSDNDFGTYLGTWGGKVYNGFHSGEDWNLKGGKDGSIDLEEKVYAIGKGKVVKISKLSGNSGWLVAIKHEGSFIIPGKKILSNGETAEYQTEKINTVYSVYEHIDNLDEFKVTLYQDVNENIPIGRIMDPGGGPHLHFEIRLDDEHKNNWSADWSLVDYNGYQKKNAYFLDLQKMIDAGLRDPSEFIEANKLSEEITTEETVEMGEKINKFDVSITINSDSSIVVTEKIAYDFGPQDRHGIYRDIPIQYKTEKGIYKLDFRVKNVVDETGSKYRYETSTEGDYTRIKIGDPNIYVTGENIYIITYEMGGALNYFDEYDELYWNVTGNNWKINIHNASCKVLLPQKVKSDDIKLTCYTGKIGSQEKNCESEILSETETYFASTKTLSPGEGLTIVLGWPKGIVK